MARKGPQLGQVEPDGESLAGYPQFLQTVAEATVSNGKALQPGDLWIDGILKADYLNIAWAERIADVPQFVQQIEGQTGQKITLIRGVASIAADGDPPLLGNWIQNGDFDPQRFTTTLERELGGIWEVILTPKDPRNPAKGFDVEFRKIGE